MNRNNEIKTIIHSIEFVMTLESEKIQPPAINYKIVEETYLVINGIQTYYEYEAPVKDSNLPVFVFVHGWTANRTRLHSLYLHYRELGYPVFRFDLRGHGWSQKEEITNFSIETLIFDVEILIQQFLISKLGYSKIILCGHSMGGLICQAIAVKQPVYLEKLILLSTSPYFLDNFWRRIGGFYMKRAWLHQFDKMLAQKKKGNEKVGLVHFPEWSETFITKNRNLFPLPQAASQTVESLMHFNVKSQIQNINVPTFIATGANDFLAHPRFARYLHKKIKNSTMLIIQECKHDLPIEKPVTLWNALDTFLKIK